ncbi:MAG: hypothetical protein NVS3B18_11080 [Candidatus Dormibacteria bacterium]
MLAPAGQAQLPVCGPGTTNTQYCQIAPAAINASPLAIACRSSNTLVHIPTTTISSVAGLRRVTVTLDGKTIKTVNTTAGNYTLKGIAVRTKGLKSGLHTVVIKVVDKDGRVSRRVLRFGICKPTPKFTG